VSRLTTVELPVFGQSWERPSISVTEYRQRIAALLQRMERSGLDIVVVYGDREHRANMAYLTGFDPRFEEALLVLSASGRPLLIVGNECMGYLPDEGIGCDVALFQPFSLMGQPRDDSRPLREILAQGGVAEGTRVGCVGWKYLYREDLLPAGEGAIEIPSYIVDTLREMVGAGCAVTNAGALLMDVEDGLRVSNSVDQIACYEYAATRTSESTLNVLRAIAPGVSECELEKLLIGDGLTLSCHRMIGFGEKARRGLASPSDNRAQLGDAFTIGFGLEGALSSRAGVVAEDPEALSGALQTFYPAYVANYFDVVVGWYEALDIGVRAGAVYDRAESLRDDALSAFAVNPGHYLHLDEWVHSPFYAGSEIPLRSGMALQMDIIPVSKGPFCYSNAEDGIVLADAALRSELAERYPQLWARVQARRAFMLDAIGIDLAESVLPLSNTPAWLAPYAMDLSKAMVKG